MIDIEHPTFQDNLDLAISRCLNIALKQPQNVPYMYPYGVTIRGRRYTAAERKSADHLGCELNMLRHLFSTYPSRGIPVAMSGLIQFLLAQHSVLSAWDQFSHVLTFISSDLAEQSFAAMDEQLRQKTDSTQGSIPTRRQQEAMPSNYATNAKSGQLALALWKRIVEELVLSMNSPPASTTSLLCKMFLQIHAFLRDPIGGLHRNLDRQYDLFLRLLHHITDAIQSRNPLSTLEWSRIIAQAAAEASYLAQPYVSNAAYIYFEDDQQITCSYVPISQLPRSEFSDSARVLKIINEILESSMGGVDSCAIAPIAVASVPCLLRRNMSNSSPATVPVIIDGNHRATATVMLKLLSTLDSPEDLLELTAGSVRRYCEEQGLGLKWAVDLYDVIQCLRLDDALGHQTRQTLMGYSHIVKSFQQVHEIPALIVEEEVFHTVDEQRSTPSETKLLMPMHQGLFNDPLSLFAFPQAGQRHGRPGGFRMLPLRAQTEPLFIFDEGDWLGSERISKLSPAKVICVEVVEDLELPRLSRVVAPVSLET